MLLRCLSAEGELFLLICLAIFHFQVENFFSPNSYSQGLDSKESDGSGEGGDEKDGLEKVISGYQPVPQQPPPSYPQGSSSLPRGASLPLGASLPRPGSKAGSLKRGVSPIPRSYPALAEAPPGYPESPQKTGPAPPGFPQSPPEFPQTPTPPGYPAQTAAKTAGTSLYPAVPEK